MQLLRWTQLLVGASALVGTDSGAAAPLTLASVRPASFATSAPTVVTVVGSGFGGTPRGWALRCRITSACPTDGHICTSFTHEGYGGGALYANATVVNDTHATCLAPAVFAPGPGLLSLCLSQGVWLCNSPTNATRVTYHSLVDVVIGRRPYLNEQRGELLVTAHPSLAGRTLRLRASLGFAPTKRWAWTVTPTAEELTAALPFELAGLPATINADMRVDVHAADLNLTIWRRLMRAPPPTTAAGAVQVDHSTMALRVNGDVFQGSGWFVAVPDWPPTHWLACTQPPINRTGCVSLWLATMRPRTALGTLSLMLPCK